MSPGPALPLQQGKKYINVLRSYLTYTDEAHLAVISSCGEKYRMAGSSVHRHVDTQVSADRVLWP